MLPRAGGGDEEENGGDRGGASTGHAMLKSRLTSVSLRGLVQVDDKAVAVREIVLLRIYFLENERFQWIFDIYSQDKNGFPAHQMSYLWTTLV